MAPSQMPQPGAQAPEFTLSAWPESEITLSQFADQQNVVLFFYPKDDTPG